MTSLRGKTPDIATAAATLAEGIAVKEPGKLTRRIVAALVADILLVDDSEIEHAIEHLVDREKLVAEGAGAAGVAALLANSQRFRGKRVGIVITGGNIDARLLASVLMRGLVREGCLVRLRSELPDLPGALSRLSGVVGESGRQHRRGPPPAPVPGYLGKARRTRRRDRNAKPPPRRGDRRRLDRRRFSDPASLGERRPRERAASYGSVASTGTTITRSTRRPSISTTSKR